MSKLSRLLLPILIVVGLLLLLPAKLTSGVRSAATRLLSPLLRTGSTFAVWTDNRYENLKNLGSLYTERDQLEARVVELEQQVASLANASHENDLLRKELAVRDRISNHETVQASIISRSAADPLGEALIDQGSRSGITVGQAVVSQGMLVGKVTEVTANTASVTLITSPRAQIQAELVDSQALGLVNGSPTGLRLTEIDQGVTLRQGEIVETSGINVGGMMPRGLVIGQVDRVVSPAGASLQEAIIHSPINFDSLRLVFVIIPQL